LSGSDHFSQAAVCFPGGGGDVLEGGDGPGVLGLPTGRQSGGFALDPAEPEREGGGEDLPFAGRDLLEFEYQIIADQAVEVPGEDGDPGGVVRLLTGLGEELVREVAIAFALAEGLVALASLRSSRRS